MAASLFGRTLFFVNPEADNDLMSFEESMKEKEACSSSPLIDSNCEHCCYALQPLG